MLPYSPSPCCEILAHVRVIPVDAGVGKSKRVGERRRPASTAVCVRPIAPSNGLSSRMPCQWTDVGASSDFDARGDRRALRHLDARTGHAAVVAEQRDRLARDRRRERRRDERRPCRRRGVADVARERRRVRGDASRHERRRARDEHPSCPASSPCAATSAAFATQRRQRHRIASIACASHRRTARARRILQRRPAPRRRHVAMRQQPRARRRSAQHQSPARDCAPPPSARR